MSDERDRKWGHEHEEPEQETPDVEGHRLYESDEPEEDEKPDVEAHRHGGPDRPMGDI